MAILIKHDGTNMDVSFKTLEERRNIQAFVASPRDWLYLNNGVMVATVNPNKLPYNVHATVIYVARSGVEGYINGDALLLNLEELRAFERDAENEEEG